jgi:hypothetical protein
LKSIQFEGCKVALKQDKTGYVLTLSMHPDDIPEDLLRDFVGSRYMVVMVRIGENEQPLERKEHEWDKYVRIAGMLCKNPRFWKFLYDESHIMEESEKESTAWLRDYLNIPSRSDLKTNVQARDLLDQIQQEFNQWNIKN